MREVVFYIPYLRTKVDISSFYVNALLNFDCSDEAFSLLNSDLGTAVKFSQYNRDQFAFV